MTNSKGVRRGTRDMFSKKFRKHGVIPLSKFMQVYRRGQIVDIKGDGSQQKSLPHKSYHGRTGVVYNVTRRGVGVMVNKRVRGRIVAKRLNLRVEHISHSKCRQDFLDRVQKNDAAKRKARESKVYVELKRQPQAPRKAHFVKVDKRPQTLRPLKYVYTC